MNFTAVYDWLIAHPFLFVCLISAVVLEAIRMTYGTFRQYKYSAVAAVAAVRARAEGNGETVPVAVIRKALDMQIAAERNDPTSHMWNQLYSRSNFLIALSSLGVLYAVWFALPVTLVDSFGSPYVVPIIFAFLVGSAFVMMFRGTASLLYPITDPVWIGFADTASPEAKLQWKMLLASLIVFLTTTLIAFIVKITFPNL